MMHILRRSRITGGDVKIDKDPDMTKLAQEARRLSMGGNNNNTPQHSSNRRSSGYADQMAADSRRAAPKYSNGGGYNRRPSDGYSSPRLQSRRQSDYRQNGSASPLSYRRTSETPSGSSLFGNRRDSDSGRRGSSSYDHENGGQENMDRRLSEAGMRRQSQADVVLNDDTSNMMVGQQVWVDGVKHGRIAFIGKVHFTKGEVAGVHLEAPLGKNNGTVGGVMYFQCEPKHGVFARLHRLTREPFINEEDEDFMHGH